MPVFTVSELLRKNQQDGKITSPTQIRVGATRPVALDIFKACDRVLYTGLLNKLKSYGISGQIFGLISSFLSNRWLRVVLDAKSLQEYPVNAGVPQGSILGPTLFLLYIIDLLDDVICNIAIYVDDTTFYSKCDHAFDLKQQLECENGWVCS